MDTVNKVKAIFFGYLILTFYYLGALVMIVAVSYPFFAEVRQTFLQHALVFEQYMIWVLYVPGILLLLASVALIFARPRDLPKGAVIASALLTLVSVLAMLISMMPLHNEWISEGFDIDQFQQSKLIIFIFQIVPSVLHTGIAVYLLFTYLKGSRMVSKILLIMLFALGFYTMGTVVVECHLNYALWSTVTAIDWPAYRAALDMGVFASVFLMPCYFPIFLLLFLSLKKPLGFSRRLIIVALTAILYVFVISAAYFVPDLQFELDKYYSKELLEELVRNEIWMRTPVEILYWVSICLMFWKFRLNTEEYDTSVSENSIL